MRTHIRTRLEADATLIAILTGGIYDASELPEDGLTPAAAPGAYTGTRLKPCAVIRFRNQNETQIVGASKRRFFEIYFYQGVGQSSIDAAAARCRTLLHPHARSKTTAGQVYYTTWMDDAGDLVADELGGAAMSYSRYYMDYLE